MDISIPVVLVYIYLANFLKDRDSTQIKELDPLQLKASMDNMISNMLLPLSFFLFCRKLVAQIVQEKQSGILEYLKMNGMSQTAYNLSFILHETFINGTLICILIDLLVYCRIERQHYLFKELFLFNVGILLFLMGASAYALLISKLFNSPGFATQIGSMLYLVPILLTLFLKVLEMKHKFSKTANEQFYGQFEDDRIRQENIRSQMILEGKLDNQSFNTDQNLQIYPFKRNSPKNESQILNDEPHYFEKISQNSLILFPHSPFCDIATEVFLVYTAKNIQNQLLLKYFMQIFDFVLIMIVILLIENYKKIYKIKSKENNKGIKNYGKNLKNGQFYDNLKQSEDEKYSQEMVITDTNLSGLKKRQTQKNYYPKNELDSNYSHLRPNNQKPFVHFQNMTKKFGSFTAVESLDLDLYKDEIFCFLGHNGAGKTTCLNVLMGKEKPSNGTVKLQLSNEGCNETMLDIRNEFQKAQSFMGVCSQNDILFESLTVYQHIYLFYRLKTSILLNSDINQQQQIKVSELIKKGVEFKVNELMKTVQLQDHSNVESQNLSGGLKRRLSIALALVSPIESSIVILDEPTTGLDAMVRDQVWQLIKQLKQNRCIVMTTQHLQEAEELADQVALLDLGKMVARGSVDEIKKKFGIGYNLIINHKNNIFENLKSNFEREALNTIKGSYFDEKISTLDKSIYVLPFQTVSQFSQLFEYLEYQNIKFTLKQTSLEDAFLNFTNIQKVNKNLLRQEQKFNQVEEDIESLIFENFKNFKNLDKNDKNQSKLKLFWYQIKAMFLKRWYSFKRDWRMWLIMIIPSLFIWCLLAIGFKRDYTPVSPMKLTSQLLSNVSNQNNGTFQNKVLTEFDPDMISGLIRDLSQLSFHGDRNKSLNLTMMGQSFFSHSFANPSVENLLKDFLAFQTDTKNDQEEDQDFKEIKQIIKDVVQKDLNLSSPYDLLMFGMKMMANQSNPESNIEQMQQLTIKLQERIQGYYERKMMPFITQIAREQAELLMIEAIRYMKEIIYLIWMIFSLSQCSGIAVENPVMERQTKIRYYLNVIGIGQAAYWIGNFIFDILCFVIQATIMVVMIYPLNLKSYQKDIGAFISLMCFFGPAHTLFSYFISFLFTDPNNALKFISIVYMISGFILPFVFKIISLGLDRCDGWVYSVSSILSQGVPLQPMSTGLIDLLTRGHWGFFQEQKERKNAENENRKAFFNSLGQQDIDPAESIFSDFQKCDGYVRNVETALWAMVISCIFSIFLLIIIERIKLLFYQSSEQSYSPSQKENDGKKILQTINLKKTYGGNVQAVKGISINLNKQKEILGLLGANGAGKSSTFNMVTMQIKRTSGDIRIFNQDISDIEYLEGINITAQQDILWPFISIEEHFQIISLIQGNKLYQNRFKCLTQKLELDLPHKYPNILSGGNKRKLCTGLTLLTGPELSFFDEPTVGLDPVARRNLLELIKSCGESVLFTTHRLDEAEYLCTRVAIMQNGRILYDGNIEDIKDSFQKGDISFTTNNKQGKNNQICQGFVLIKKPLIDLRKSIRYLEIEQEYSDQILFKIVCNFGENQIRLSQIFSDLSNLKNEQEITDFSYFEPSLHHIFVALNQERVKSD